MIDWNALLQTIVASGAVAVALSYVFNRKLKEYEAKLRELTELRVKIGMDRIEEYKKLSNLVTSVRKHAVDLCEMSDPTEDEISAVVSKVDDLQKAIHNSCATMRENEIDYGNEIYERVHSYKVQLRALIGNVENERKRRDEGQTKRADGVREDITRSIADIQSESKSIVDILAGLIHKAKEGDL